MPSGGDRRQGISSHDTDPVCLEYCRYFMGEINGTRERLSLSAFLRTEDIGVHIVHISRLIITYTLE